MSKTNKAIKATIRHFEDAANHAGDAAHAINITATGLVCLTGLIADLIEEVEALRAEVKTLQNRD